MSPAAPGTVSGPRRSAVRHAVEYALLRGLLWLIERAPMAVSEAVVRGTADLWYALCRGRRRIAIGNILQCGITADRRTAAGIARRSYRNFALLILETLRSGRRVEGAGWRRHVDLRIEPAAEALFSEPGRGILMATGHLGSSEIAARVLSHWKPVAAVARRMNNPRVEAWRRGHAPGGGFYRIPKYDKRNLGRFLSILRQGHVLALMVDQHASWGGVRVPFFGRPAYTYATLPLLHLVTGAPVCFGYCRRLGPLRYEVRVEGPIRYERTGNREADVRAIIADLNRRLEAAIRECPDQYLWGHRRWKEQMHRRAAPESPGDMPPGAPPPPSSPAAG